MDEALKAIAEPHRREILGLVARRELAAGEIARHFEQISRPAVSQHLGVLRDAGLLSERRDGTRRLYRARPEGLAELNEYIQGFWHAGLERLKAAAEDERGRARDRKDPDAK